MSAEQTTLKGLLYCGLHKSTVQDKRALNVWTGKTHRKWQLNVSLWGAEERLITEVNEKKDKGNRKGRNEENVELMKKKKHKRK